MIRANPGIDAIFGCCDFAPAGRSRRSAPPASRSRSTPPRRRVRDADGALGCRGARSRTTSAERSLRSTSSQGSSRPGRHPEAHPGAYQMKIIDQSNAAGLPLPDGEDARAVQGAVGEAVPPATGLMWIARALRRAWAKQRRASVAAGSPEAGRRARGVDAKVTARPRRPPPGSSRTSRSAASPSAGASCWRSWPPSRSSRSRDPRRSSPGTTPGRSSTTRPCSPSWRSG